MYNFFVSNSYLLIDTTKIYNYLYYIIYNYNTIWYVQIMLQLFYNVANILVKPTAAESNVCPTPQNIAYNGCIWILDAR